MPVSASYSLAITDSPAPCVVVSHCAHENPNPNGSVAAWATRIVERLLQVREQLRPA